jgi:hypothetical protein
MRDPAARERGWRISLLPRLREVTGGVEPQYKRQEGATISKHVR